MPWTGVEQTRLASLVESTQNLCRGPRGTTHFLESVKNRFALDRKERESIAFEKQQHFLSQTTCLKFLSWSDWLD